MFWNEAKRRWERHPDCRCQHKDGQPCICLFLSPLDANGKPIRGTLTEKVAAGLKALHSQTRRKAS